MHTLSLSNCMFMVLCCECPPSFKEHISIFLFSSICLHISLHISNVYFHPTSEAQPVQPEPLVSGTEPLLPADISQTDAAQPDVAQEEVAVNDQTAPQTEDGDKPVDDTPPTANQEDSSGPQAEPTPDTAELPADNTEAAADNTEAAGEVTGGASEEQDDFTEAKTLADRIISASIERERADVMGAGDPLCYPEFGVCLFLSSYRLSNIH